VNEKYNYLLSACFFENSYERLLRKPRHSFCSGFSLLSLVNFLQCTCHIRLSEQFSESQAAFGTTFRVTGGYLGNKLPEEGYLGDFQN
jgi:hypothetical protein